MRICTGPSLYVVRVKIKLNRLANEMCGNERRILLIPDHYELL